MDDYFIFYHLLWVPGFESLFKDITLQSHQNSNFNLNNFSMSKYKSEITNEITGIDIIQKSYVIF